MTEVWLDVPEGWKYGFPKKVYLAILANESLFRIYLESNGYPTTEIDLALNYYRYWAKDSADEI